MQVSILREDGFEEALYGLSLSFKDRAIPKEEWWTVERFEKIQKTAKSLAFRGNGHNKFLESMAVWIDVEAPRYWWSEMDTYRVGTSKQSESTMHTLSKRDMTLEDLQRPSTGFSSAHAEQVDSFNSVRHTKNIQFLKSLVPESYLQRRVICTNYKVLQNIMYQRWDHKLPEWEIFCGKILEQVRYPEFLPQGAN